MEDRDPQSSTSGIKAPQEYGNYRQRGPKKFGITYQQISELTGIPVKRLYRFHAEKGVDFGDLKTLVEFVKCRLLRALGMAARSFQRERTVRRIPT